MPTPGRVMTSTPTEAGNDRQPAPPARPFAEQRPGQRGDHHRREEEDRGRLGELQRLQRQEIEDGRAEQEHAAQHLRRQIDEPEHRRVAPAPEQDQHDHDMAGKAHPGDEGRRHARQHQVFGAGVEAGEQHAGGDHEQDRRHRSRVVRGMCREGDHWKSRGRTARLVGQSGKRRQAPKRSQPRNPANQTIRRRRRRLRSRRSRRRRDWPRCAKAAWQAPSAPSCRAP